MENNEVKVKINKAGKKILSISPKSATTDTSGEAVFTIKAKKVTGRARITFTAGSLKKYLVVKVKS